MANQGYFPISNLAGHVFADMYTSIIQGTWIHSIGGGRAYAYWLLNSPAALNDEIEYTVFAGAGTKTFELFCSTGIGRGIITVYLDDVSLGTIDLYSDPSELNVFKPLAATVVGGGAHTIRIKVTGKNPLATGYAATFTWLRIKD